MSEENKTDDQKKDTELENSGSVHLWSDELALKKSQKKIKHLKRALVIVVIAGVLLGWLGGSLVPMSFLNSFRSRLNAAFGLSSDDKIAEVLKIMENDWYFGSSIDNLDERLKDQALTAITSNSEDTHTEYMSAEETSSFAQSINRNYVGIGVGYIQNGDTNMIEEVFKDSPAEKAGVKAGDIIHAIDGTVIDGMSSSDIKDLIQGDEGTKVSITFIREGQYMTLEITRAAVSATAFGKKLDDGTIYLRLAQFGEGTVKEVKGYLKDLAVDESDKMILDLRNNGGGYLDSVAAVASLFLPSGETVMSEQYASGPNQTIRTSGGQLTNIHQIVILVNGDTASAAEVMTLALKQQRDDVTIVGTTTYGKGTVQVTRTFSDGSAIKYTTAKWVSPDGTWVNGVGITPDETVRLHDALYNAYAGMEDDESYSFDSVADAVKDMQLCLDYLGYAPDRQDGYFSEASKEALSRFESDHALTADGVLNKTAYEALISAVRMDWGTTSNHDTQLQKAQEILHDGK